MKFGLTIFPTEYTAQPGDFAKRAEERGFESVWFPEHTHIPVDRKSPWAGGPELPREYYNSYDPFVALAAAATTTRDLKLATGICLIIQRDPITTAKEVATLDRISNGRVIFGIGGGWNLEEVENHGTPRKLRFPILRERVQAMKTIWTEEKPEFHGKYVDFEPMFSNPKPVQKPHPPVVMGGDGPTTFDRVLAFCDGWMPISRHGVLPAGLEDKVRDLRKRVEAAGRDPASISVSLFTCPPKPEVVDEVERMGVDRVVFGIPAAAPAEVWKTLDERAKLIR
jgi:probable F420-dependent oxidoreductase